MKKVFYLLTLVMFLGCEELTSVPEEFVFTINGTEMNFSDNISVSKNWVTGEIEITGKKTGVGKVTLTVHDTETGTFDENDYSFDEDNFTYNYKLRYVDNNDNSYTYYTSSINEWFNINIDKFSNRIDGEVSGEFSGLLEGSILNNSGSDETVLIENGKFSTKLINKID